jgi:hypothetical protein
MKQMLGVGLVCVLFALTPAAASNPGERIEAEDLVLVYSGLGVVTFVDVDLSFDYTTCDAFPVPVDLRCGLLATSQIDAEGRQYASRYTNSTVSDVLPRSEIWRTLADGGSEMVAYLEPRAGNGGTFDDGRIERIAVDQVRGEILVQLTTACYPIGDSGCSYDRANAIIRLTGLLTLADVLRQPVAASTGSNVPLSQPAPDGNATATPLGKQRGSR